VCTYTTHLVLLESGLDVLFGAGHEAAATHYALLPVPMRVIRVFRMMRVIRVIRDIG
jgi:hypothetical protein